MIVIGLGAGVQSSTMALMAAHGLIEPMPDCAIFADTQWEPRAVYDWLDWLEGQLPFPVHRVTGGDLRAEQLTARMRGYKDDDGGRWASLPYFVTVPDQSKEARVRRQCTSEYKIQPIEKFIRRELLGLEKGQRVPKGVTVEQWRGISADEASRMKPSGHKWMTVRYPLAMEHRMTRHDCLMWMFRNGYPVPPRSACIGCPFHSDHEWRQLRDTSPEEWRDACEFDDAIRKAGGMRGETFLHRSCVPLRDADIDDDQNQANLFGNECEGMCGV